MPKKGDVIFKLQMVSWGQKKSDHPDRRQRLGWWREGGREKGLSNASTHGRESVNWSKKCKTMFWIHHSPDFHL